MNQTIDLIVAKLLKRFEGCRLHAYQDSVGVWTIGYGETLNVVEGMVWTQEQADTALRTRAAYFLLSALAKCPQLALEKPERVAACVSLAYNIGVSAFGVSSVCRKTKRKDYSGAADAFKLWNKARGRVLKGLTWRRGVESKIYLSCAL
jgi:lysozyme